MARKTVAVHVILASSETNRDQFYATGFSAGDPFCFFQIGWRKYMIASDLEIGRAREQSKVHHVLPMSKYIRRLKRHGKENPGLTDVLIEALAEKGVTRARVPHDFPVFTADRMRRAGIGIQPVVPPFWPDRVVKTEDEIDSIRTAIRKTEEAMREGIDAIRRSRPRGARLYLDGKVLTSETVRGIIHRALMDREMTPKGTIVAGGEQAVDPHNEGSGPLRAGWPVILDVFPRCNATGYHADISRTVLRGKPGKRHLEMWDAVHEAQAKGCDLAVANATGREVHEAVKSIFTERGFETGPANGKMQGFFHGTGHGLGLAVHEAPRVGAVDDPLRPGMVVTIEPGLYYPGVGGIRIEDDVVVREGRSENLVELEKEFVL